MNLGMAGLSATVLPPLGDAQSGGGDICAAVRLGHFGSVDARGAGAAPMGEWGAQNSVTVVNLIAA